MNKPPSSLHEERLAAAVEHAQQKVAAGERALIEVFIREYYRQVDPDDLAARSADDLAGAALSHWELGRVRAPGAPACGCSVRPQRSTAGRCGTP